MRHGRMAGLGMSRRRRTAVAHWRRGVAPACATLLAVTAVAFAGISASKGPADLTASASSRQAAAAASSSTADGSAVPAGTTPSRASARGIRRYNVGATHSPRLLHDLSGPLNRTGLHNRARLGQAATAMTVQQPASASSTANMLQGVDVASFQHPNGAAINWADVAGAGYTFAAIKATEGNYYKNPYYPTDSAQATAAGLYVAAYAFAIPNVSDGTSQADYAVNYTSYKIGGLFLPVMVDLEYDPYASSDGTNECYGLSASAMVNWISQFVTETQNLTGQPPVIYTTSGWWDTCTGNSTAFSADVLWPAAYAINTPPLPAGWNDWNFWQYSSSGTVPGIDTPGTTDLDYFTAGPSTQQTLAGSAVSAQVRSFNALAGQSVTYSATGLPAGLSMTAGGLISGTASTPGAYAVTITPAGSSAVLPASESFTWYVHGTVAVTSPGNQNTVAGSPAGLQIQATDSAAGYKPAFTASGLPPGLSINSVGRISGWPYQTGTYQVKITATDGLQASGTTSFTWTVTSAADAGTAGALRLDNGGKCLDDTGKNTANGTRMEIWTCTGGTNQHWTVVQDGTLRVYGKCLDVYHGGTANGTAVDLYSCNGSGSQRWQIGADGELVNPQSGKCLDDPYSNNANGTKLDIWTCTGGTNQRWTGPASPFPLGIPGKCLDDTGYSTANGARMEIWTCTGSANQHWTVLPDGTIRVYGKCLTVYGSGTASGTAVDLYGCTGAAGQFWKMVPQGPIGSELVNPHSGLCLADPADSAANGTKLVTSPCPASTDPGTSWHIM
jgi:GH25 family lysozyme M1 (1,4-beta-N-acetylmuramidase)